MMRLLLLLACFVAVAACQPVKPRSTAAKAPVDGVVVQISATGQRGRDLMHEVAARCWLDGVVGGAQLIIWPDGNTLEIAGETQKLVRAEYVGRAGRNGRWHLTGQSVNNPAQRARLVQTLDLAVKTGDTSCPILAS
ncbi:MAG: hypothetical protein AAF557_18680 [Pseudomonadota bacterium]